MPVSEDELDNGYGTHQQQLRPGNIMSKAELRRSNKPIMEKRRRARINHCLNELKSIILDAMKKDVSASELDPARHSKLEKADILEMTVKHLQSIQRQQLTMAVSSDPSVVHKFQSGFSECAGEVSRYIGRMEGVETGVKQRLVSHLASCVNGLQQITPFTIPANSSATQSSAVNEDVNNNTASARLQMMTGLQLIPSRLPTGELALLLPNSQHLPFFPAPLENQVSTTTESPKSTITSNTVDRSHNSAFTAVKKDDKLFRSPLPSPTSTTASSYGDDSCDQPYPSPSHLPEVTSTSEHPKSTFDASFTSYIQKPSRVLDSQSLLKIAPPQIMDLNNETTKRIHNIQHPTAKVIQTPLTVITSNEMLKEHPQKLIPVQPQPSFKDPLDFSLKKDAFTISNSSSLFKRPYLEDSSNKFVVNSSELQPSLKVPKMLSEIQTQNIQFPERKSLFEIQNHTSKLDNENNFQINNQNLPERRNFIAIHNQPSTSSDMWRPW